MNALLQMSVRGGFFIGCICILRKVLWKKLSKRLLVILWLFACLRLILPFKIYTPLAQ